jgi:uroporphyrinogen III methyltransferase/synthase
LRFSLDKSFYRPHSLNSSDQSRFSQPLSGQTIVSTRAKSSPDALLTGLKELGADVISHPVIQIRPPADLTRLDETIGRIDTFDWLVFVSPNGVKSFLNRAANIQPAESQRLGQGEIKFAAIGPSTAQCLRDKFQIEADLIPKQSNSSSLALALIEQVTPNQNLLIVRANRGSDELTNQLKLAVAPFQFEEVVAYQSLDVETADPELLAQMAEGKIDWVTITSSAIANSAIGLFGDSLHQTKLASISPATSRVLKDAGFSIAAQATNYNMQGLVDAIVGATR